MSRWENLKGNLKRFANKNIDASKAVRNINKIAPKNLKNRQLIKDSKQVTVVENQPVYSEDRSRFFKKSWEVSKRQLYFD